MKHGRVGRGILTGLVAVFAATPGATAQDAPTPVAVTVDLGFMNTAGNTEVTTVNAGDKLVYTAAPFVLTQTFGIVYGRTGDSTTTNQWKAGVRFDYQLVPRVSVFGQGRFERNTFAGINRRFEEAVGVAALLLDAGGNKLTAEAGASLNQQTSSITDVTESFTAGRAATEYRRALTEAAYLTLGGEFLPNFEASEDYRINGLAALVAPISKAIALKASYEVRFDNLPEPTFEKTDRILTTGLQIVF